MKKSLFELTLKTLMFLGALGILQPKAIAAERISFENGLFNRTVSVEEIEYLAKTGKAKGPLKNLLKLTSIETKEVYNLLNQQLELPLVVTTKLMYSSIGEVIIMRVAKIIHPIKLTKKRITLPAIRSGVISGIIMGNGKLSLIDFIKSYPNKVMAINIPALYKIINKVDSISDLVKYFSSSPLEQLKEREL